MPSHRALVGSRLRRAASQVWRAGGTRPPVSEEGLHSTGLCVWAPLAVLDGEMQVAQRRALLRGWISDPPTCSTPQWRRESAKLFLSLFLVIRSCPDPGGHLPVKEAVLEMAFVCVTLAVSANLFSQFA